MNISLDSQDICSLATNTIHSLLFYLNGGDTLSYRNSTFKTVEEFVDFLEKECSRREQLKIDIMQRAQEFEKKMKELGL